MLYIHCYTNEIHKILHKEDKNMYNNMQDFCIVIKFAALMTAQHPSLTTLNTLYL